MEQNLPATNLYTYVMTTYTIIGNLIFMKKELVVVDQNWKVHLRVDIGRA